MDFGCVFGSGVFLLEVPGGFVVVVGMALLLLLLLLLVGLLAFGVLLAVTGD